MKSMNRTPRAALKSIFSIPALVAVAVLTGCAAPFADLQGARLAGKGRVQVTPSFSKVGFASSGGDVSLQREYTLQVAGGVTENLELRGRYTRITPPGGSGGEGGVNVIGAGPKVGLVPGRLAVGLPVGLAFGEGIEASETLQAHPTVFFTVPAHRNLEVNLSGKALVPLRGGDVGLAANLGLGLSTDLDRWAVRPEVGVLKYPGDEGYIRQVSIGLTLGSKP